MKNSYRFFFFIPFHFCEEKELCWEQYFPFLCYRNIKVSIFFMFYVRVLCFIKFLFVFYNPVVPITMSESRIGLNSYWKLSKIHFKLM